MLARAGVAQVRRARLGARTLVLAYHNIRPDGAEPAGDRSLHLPLSGFRRQLDLLQKTHEVVSLPQVLHPGSGRPRVAITFDDAYRGAVRFAIPELVARGLPATIFVAPALLGGMSFWWDVLAGADGLAEPVRTAGLIELRGREVLIRDWAVREGVTVRESPEDCRGADEAELTTAADAPGITLGSHTWSHPNLARATADELREELTSPLDWLQRRFGDRVLRWISYPYGCCSPAVAGAAEAAGYEAGLRVDGGWHWSGQGERFGLPRLNIPAGLSPDGFRLRLAGMFCQ